MGAKKIFFLALAMFIAIMVYESCRPPSGCNGTNTFYYSIKNPKTTNVRTTDTSHRSGFYPLDTTKMTYRNFNWAVNFDYQTYCRNNKQNLNLPSLFTTALAYPAPPNYECKEKVAEFVVTTTNDYDDAHLAGSNINDILNISWQRPESPLMVQTVYHLAEFMSFVNRPVEGNSFILYLTKPPRNNGNLQARINIKLSNGQVFEINTTPVYLSK